MDDCIFCKIANKELPKEFTYEDELVMAFPDTQPQKPTHILVIPKKHIHDFTQLDDQVLLDRIRQVIQNLIREFNLNHSGFKIMVNGGGLQHINHLHFHLLGPMGRA